MPLSKPSPDALKDYLDHGPGTDQKAPAYRTTAVESYLGGSRSFKRTSIELPVDLHKRFKVGCLMNDERMNEVIINLIAKQCEEWDRSE